MRLVYGLMYFLNIRDRTHYVRLSSPNRKKQQNRFKHHISTRRENENSASMRYFLLYTFRFYKQLTNRLQKMRP